MVTLNWPINSKGDDLTIFNGNNWVPYFIFNSIGDSKIVYYVLSFHYLLWILLFRDVHGNMDRLICPDCGKLFTSKRSLFGHKKEKHTGAVEIFPCPDCGKNFSRKSNLKVSFFIQIIISNFILFLPGPPRFLTFWQEIPLLLLWANFHK